MRLPYQHNPSCCSSCGVSDVDEELVESPAWPRSRFCPDCFVDAEAEAREERDDELELFIDGVGFASAGSALRAETPDNPRNLPCGTCHRPNRLTPLDEARGYQCDACAERSERGEDVGCVLEETCPICAAESQALLDERDA